MTNSKSRPSTVTLFQKGTRQPGASPGQRAGVRKWAASQGPAAPLHTEVPEETSKVGSVSSRDHLRQANGKKKLKGSLALMVGRALKPASAGADTATKVTAVETRTVLSFPALVCNRDASPTLRGETASLLFLAPRLLSAHEVTGWPGAPRPLPRLRGGVHPAVLT